MAVPRLHSTAVRVGFCSVMEGWRPPPSCRSGLVCVVIFDMPAGLEPQRAGAAHEATPPHRAHDGCPSSRLPKPSPRLVFPCRCHMLPLPSSLHPAFPIKLLPCSRPQCCHSFPSMPDVRVSSGVDVLHSMRMSFPHAQCGDRVSCQEAAWDGASDGRDRATTRTVYLI